MRRVGKPRCKAFVNEATHTHTNVTAAPATPQGTHFETSSSKGKQEGSGANSNSHLWADFRESYINDLFQHTLTPPPVSLNAATSPASPHDTGREPEPTRGATSALGPAYSAQLRYKLFKHLVFKTLQIQAISEANTAGAPHPNT